MKVLITGASGQIAKEISDTCPKSVSLHPYSKSELDISDHKQTQNMIRSLSPDIVINTAAYTNVDQAEIDKELAYEINSYALKSICQACKDSNSRLIHFSTDYIFGGSKSKAYEIDDEPNPLNIYGDSKLQGEKEILQFSDLGFIILRTSWVYSRYGNNFVKSMISLLNSKSSIDIVSDQVGTPTWARSIAILVWKIIKQDNPSGIYHYTDKGITDWYHFAKQIQEEAFKLKLINKKSQLNPVTTDFYNDNYNVKAKRPLNSKLNCELLTRQLKIKQEDWQINLKKMLKEYGNKI